MSSPCLANVMLAGVFEKRGSLDSYALVGDQTLDRHLALVMLHQHEAAQLRAEMAADAVGQRRHDRLALRRQIIQKDGSQAVDEKGKPQET